MIRFLGSRRFLKGYILLGVALLGVGLLVYSVFLIRGLEEDTRTTSRIYARFCAGCEETEIIFDEVVKRIDFPVIFTDREGNPQGWQNLGSEDPSPEEMKALIEELGEGRPPVPIKVGPDSLLLGYVYYGIPRLTRLLGLAPVFLLAMIGFFIVIAFLGFRTLKDSEQNFVWLGMAKETAHQFGTPLSSLSGWIELLRRRSDSHEIVSEMERDLSRLYRVSSRFSRIGASPRLAKRGIVPILKDTADYFKERVGKGITIRQNYSEIPEVAVDEELFSWVVENLVRNSQDAIDSDGVVEISAAVDPRRRCVVIVVKDDGRGMTKEEQRNAFKPGYTTKEFGWGLGLPLAKRIIESYHNGKLRLKESQVSKGSSFEILLPIDEGKEDTVD